jgi:hypothetical protein
MVGFRQPLPIPSQLMSRGFKLLGACMSVVVTDNLQSSELKKQRSWLSGTARESAVLDFSRLMAT